MRIGSGKGDAPELAPAGDVATLAPVVAGRPLRRARRGLPALRRVGRYGDIAVGTAVLLGIVLAGLFAPLPYDPIEPDASAILRAPGGGHLFGTDGSGFDVFSRTIWAARRDVPLAMAGVLVSLLVGVPLGLVAGAKARGSEWLMRAIEVFQAFPLIVLAIVIVKVSGNRAENVILALAIVQIPRFMRLVRADVLAIRESRFVEAATAMGCTRLRVLFRHILPNVTGIILVQCSLAAANGIIVVASLNFVGLGANPPEPAWGLMIQDGAQYIPQGAWWIAIFPGLAIFVTVFAFNMIADGFERVFGGGTR